MLIPLAVFFFSLVNPNEWWKVQKPKPKAKRYAKMDTRHPDHNKNNEQDSEGEENMEGRNRRTNHGEGTSKKIYKHMENINKPLDDIILENARKERQKKHDEEPYKFRRDDSDHVERRNDFTKQKIPKRARDEEDEDDEDNLVTPIYKKSSLYEMMKNMFTQLSSKVETPSIPTLAGGGKNDLEQFSTYPADILKLSYKTRNLMEQLESSLYSTSNFDAQKFEEIKRATAAMSRLSALNIRSLHMASTQPNLTTHLGHAMSMAAYAYKDNAPSSLKDPKEDDKLWPEDASLRESWPMEKNRSYAQQAAASLGITFRNGFNNNSTRPRYNANNTSPFPYGSTFDSNQGGIIPAPPPRGGGSFPVNLRHKAFK